MLARAPWDGREQGENTLGKTPWSAVFHHSNHNPNPNTAPRTGQIAVGKGTRGRQTAG